MNIDKLKNPLSCLLGSIVLMGLIYSIFFGAESIKDAFNASIIFLAAISWKPIYFIFGCAILFLQCMIYNNEKGRYNLFLVITLVTLVLFAFLCLISNSDAFSWRAVFYSILILAISQLVVMWRKAEEKDTEDKFFCKLFIGICIVLLGVTLFIDQKSDPNSEREKIAADLDKQDLIDKERAKEKPVTQIREVEEKYQKQFKELGFTKVYSNNKDVNYLHFYEMIDFKFEKPVMLITNGDANKLVAEDIKEKIDFENISFHIEKDKLTIKGLVYDKKLVSQQQLAVSLDIVMHNLIIPELLVVKKEIDRQKNNIASHTEK